MILEDYLSIQQLTATYLNTDLTRWWSDISLGSELYQLINSKTSVSFLADFDSKVLLALEPLKKDGLAKDISISSEFITKSSITYELIITRPDGTTDVIAAVWEGV